MSCKNDNNAVIGKVYSSIDRPPKRSCGGDYIDYSKLDAPECSYWGKSLTVQADEVNSLQNVLKKGGMPVAVRDMAKAQYGDFAAIPDYRDALNLVMDAQAQFMSLDASIRVKFDNDPAKFLDFIGNPANDADAVKLGLKAAKLPPNTPVDSLGKPMAAPVAPDATNASKA